MTLRHRKLWVICRRLRPTFYFDAVLVNPGEEAHLMAANAIVAGDDVGGYFLVSMTNVRCGVDIVDGRGYVELFITLRALCC